LNYYHIFSPLVVITFILQLILKILFNINYFDKSGYIAKFLRSPFRPDAIAFENMKNLPGRLDSGINSAMYPDLSKYNT
jgi:hypothetical protein